MNAALLLWARAEWRRRWAVLALLGVLVAVAGGTSLAAVAAARRTDTAFDRFLAATHTPNLTINTDDFTTFLSPDARELDQVMQITGVRGAWALAFLGIAPAGYPNFFGVALLGIRGEAPQWVTLQGPGDRDPATWPVERMLVNEAMADALDVHVGDHVPLLSQTPEQFFQSLAQGEVGAPAGPAITATVGEVGRFATDISDSPAPIVGVGTAYFARYHEEVGNCACTIEMYVDPHRLAEVQAAVTGMFPGTTVNPATTIGASLDDTTSLQARAWWAIAAAAMAAGLLAVLQAAARLARLLADDDRTHRALGWTRRDRRLGSLVVLAPAAVLGTAGAAGVAYALSGLSPVGVTRRAEPDPGLRWDPRVLLPGLAVVLVAAWAAAGLASVLGHRRRRELAGARRFGGPVTSFGRRLAFGPGLAAVAGAAIAVTGLSGAITLERSIDHVIATPRLYGADFDAAVEIVTGADKRPIADRLAADPDIEAVAVGLGVAPPDDVGGVHVVSARGSADVAPGAIDDVKGVTTVLPRRGRPPGRPDEVSIGPAVARLLGVGVGDTVTVTASRGTVDMVVVGEHIDPFSDDPEGGFVATGAGLERLVNPTASSVTVRFRPGVDRQQVLDRYADVFLTAATPPARVAHLGELGGLPLRLGWLLALLGAAAALNASVQVVRAARHQIAVHRALGFTARQVLGVHVWQGVITAVVGAVVGGAVGVVAGRAVHRQLVLHAGARPGAVWPGALWWVVGLTLAACVFGAVVVSGVALRRRPGEVLHAE